MTINLLARRNLSGNLQRYVAYFFSCVFAVTIFFIYAQFIFHPDVVSGDIRAGEAVRRGMMAAQIIIVLFSMFFLLLIPTLLFFTSPCQGIRAPVPFRNEQSAASQADLL